MRILAAALCLAIVAAPAGARDAGAEVSADEPAFNVRLAPSWLQPVEHNALTPVRWAGVSERFPTTEPVFDPATPEDLRLVRPGLYLATFVVTFSPGSGARKAHLMVCGAEACRNAFDGGEVRAAPGRRETTVTGAGFVRSDGATTLQLLVLQDSRRTLTLSEREYEMQLHVHQLGP